MTENMKQQSNRPCDVLIIGGGSAGLRAAIDTITTIVRCWKDLLQMLIVKVITISME